MITKHDAVSSLIRVLTIALFTIVFCMLGVELLGLRPSLALIACAAALSPFAAWASDVVVERMFRESVGEIAIMPGDDTAD